MTMRYKECYTYVIYIYVCVRACVRSYVRTYVRACVRVCICIHINTCTCRFYMHKIPHSGHVTSHNPVLNLTLS